MKQFIAFIRKEFYHILRDRRTMLILIGMPIVQIILSVSPSPRKSGISRQPSSRPPPRPTSAC